MDAWDLSEFLSQEEKEIEPIKIGDRTIWPWEKEYGGWTKEKAIAYYEEKIKAIENPPEDIQPLKDKTKKCPVCGKFFYPARGFYDVTHFCSGRCKQRAYRENKKLFRDLPTLDYSELTFSQALAQMMEEDPCYYCGLIADTIDHTVPQWLIKRSFDQNEFLVIPGIKNKLVRACRECNSTISGKVFKNLTDRRKYVQQQYKLKYKKLLSLPEWTEDQLNELAGRLQESVRASMAQRRVVLYRLKWPDI